MSNDVIIIGAGLSGLCCAKELNARGCSSMLFEATDRVGGRIRTEHVEGFRLDRGFQVFLTGYPEARKLLDYEALQLKSFQAGALIRYAGKFHRLVDPWRNPASALSSLLNPIGSMADKLRVGLLRRDCLRDATGRLTDEVDQTTRDYLKNRGFSDRFIHRFFEPFLGGVFLDAKLETGSRMLKFVFGMFAGSEAALPSDGMQAIPHQLANGLPEGSIQFHSPVTEIGPGFVRLSDGTRREAKHIVVATEAPVAKRLLLGTAKNPNGFGRNASSVSDGLQPEEIRVAGRGVSVYYYQADRSPLEMPLLVLNGDRSGPINNLCVPSDIAATYAPSGKSLISVTVLGVPEDLEKMQFAVEAQLTEWFGRQTAAWKFLAAFPIPYALPDQTSPVLATAERSVRWSDGVYICGDHRDHASIQGAMVSGRRVAEAVLHDLK